MSEPTTAERPVDHEVVIIGAGQAGLSASWHLTQRGVEHVVLERDGVGHDWRDRRWDNFTLVTPNWQCQLPRFPYQGDDPDGFMRRDEVYAYVRAYAASFGAPVREGVTVTSLQPRVEGGFAIETATDAPLTADAVIIATGGYHVPRIPRWADRLDPRLHQLHSAGYRSAEVLPPGAVVVVGTGQSGAQIAEDLHLAGRQVHLVTGTAPRVARFYRGRDCVAWLADMGTYDVPVEQQPGGLAAREKTNHYVTGRGGGRDIDLRSFALEGMRLYGRLTDARDTALTFAPTLTSNLDGADAVSESIKDAIDAHIARHGIDAPTEQRYVPVWRPPVEPSRLDLDAAGVSTVVWATGFRGDWGWVKAPIFDGEGMACHRRGVTAVPGLHVLGLPWLHTWGSGRFAGIARDAAHVVDVLTTDRAALRVA
jgi:putative flavoprotein involved in K+ transport